MAETLPSISSPFKEPNTLVSQEDTETYQIIVFSEQGKEMIIPVFNHYLQVGLWISLLCMNKIWELKIEMRENVSCNSVKEAEFFLYRCTLQSYYTYNKILGHNSLPHLF